MFTSVLNADLYSSPRSLMPPPASVMKLASAASSSVPLPNQISGAAVPGGAAAVVRDKKTGGNYSAAGDDDINDVAAMGGVNLAEEANVSINTQIVPSSLVQPHPIFEIACSTIRIRG